MTIPFFRPLPAPPAVFEDEALPWQTANPLSKLFFQYIAPILKVGWSRPLKAEGAVETFPEHGNHTYCRSMATYR